MLELDLATSTVDSDVKSSHSYTKSSQCSSARNSCASSIDFTTHHQQSQTQTRESSRSFSTIINPLNEQHNATPPTVEKFVKKQGNNNASASLLPVLKQISKAPSKTELLNRRKHWGFVKTNTALLSAKTYAEKINEPKYTSYLEVPNCLEIIENMQKERKEKQNLLDERRQQHYISNFENTAAENQVLHTKLKFQMMMDVATQKKHATNEKESRLYAKLQKIVKIVSQEPSKRSFPDLLILYQWLKKHCSKNSILFEFLKNVNYLDGIHFVQGLRYNIYDINACVIKQNEIGNDFFILLSGEVSVHVNENLVGTSDLPNVKTNEKMLGKLGIGESIDQMTKMGDSFGECALISGKPRNATILCSRISQFLICTRKHFQQCLEKYTNQITDAKIQELKQFYIFNQCPKYWLQTVLKRFSTTTLNAGSLILEQNKTPEKVYFLLNAKCEQTYHSTCNLRSNTGIVIKLLSGQQMIGAYYAVNEMKSPCNVIVTKTCQAIVIDKSKFVQSMTKTVIEKINQVGLGQHQHTMNQLKQMKRNIREEIISEKTKTLKSQFNKKTSSVEKAYIDFTASKSVHMNGNTTRRMQRIRSVSVLPPNTKSFRNKTKPKFINAHHHHVQSSISDEQNAIVKTAYINNTQRRLRSRSLTNVKAADIDTTSSISAHVPQSKTDFDTSVKKQLENAHKQVKEQVKHLNVRLSNLQHMHHQVLNKQSIENNHRITIKNKRKIKQIKRIGRRKGNGTSFDTPLMAVKRIDMSTKFAHARKTPVVTATNGVQLPRLVFPSKMRTISQFQFV